MGLIGLIFLFLGLMGGIGLIIMGLIGLGIGLIFLIESRGLDRGRSLIAH